MYHYVAAQGFLSGDNAGTCAFILCIGVMDYVGCASLQIDREVIAYKLRHGFGSEGKAAFAS